MQCWEASIPLFEEFGLVYRFCNYELHVDVIGKEDQEPEYNDNEYPSVPLAIQLIKKITEAKAWDDAQHTNHAAKAAVDNTKREAKKWQNALDYHIAKLEALQVGEQSVVQVFAGGEIGTFSGLLYGM